MKSSWPIVIGFVAVAYAAVWYDARNATAASVAPPVDASNASAAVVSTR